ncbi:hypothetical protein YC2023_059126 [Brassica napus]
MKLCELYRNIGENKLSGTPTNPLMPYKFLEALAIKVNVMFLVWHVSSWIESTSSRSQGFNKFECSWRQGETIKYVGLTTTDEGKKIKTDERQELKDNLGKEEEDIKSFETEEKALRRRKN